MANIRQIQRNTLDWVVRHHPALGLDQRAEYFVERFQTYLKQASRVLDIGGGWGFYAEPLEKRGHHLTILDVVKPGLQKAPVVIYEGTGQFPFPDKSFDASMLITVLHHVEKPEAILAEARRVTQKNLIVVEDLYHHTLGRLWTQWRDQIFNFEFFGHPCQFRKREEWLRLFEKSGYSLLAEEKVYTWLSGLRILNGIFVLEVK